MALATGATISILKVRVSAFTVIGLVYCLYAALFIYRTSFVINGERYFALFDDEMVSMRYAKNLAEGHGLVWNPGGERVEGYTNLLWVLYLAVIHLLPVDPSKISVLVQLTGALLLLANLVVVKRIAGELSGGSTFVSLAAVLLTAFYLPLNTWGLQGTEVSALTLLLSLAAYQSIRYLHSGRSSVWIYPLFGFGTLIRLDFVVPLLATLVFMLWADPWRKMNHAKHGLLTLLLFIGSQSLFRIFYYGEILPNTYYLKMTGFPVLLRISRGVYVAALFIYRMNPLLFLAPFTLLLIRRDKPLLYLFWIFLAQVGYSMYVGGDAWEGWGGSNRFVSVAMPLFLILLAIAIYEVTRLIWERRPARIKLKRRYLTPTRVAILLGSLVALNAGVGHVPLGEWSLITRSLDVQGNAKYVEIGLWLRDVTAETATVAVVWAGSTPYFSDRYAIDLLGKSDRRIARQDARPEILTGRDPLTAFYPGHSKWDLEYSIGEQRPDVVVGWEGTILQPMPYTPGDYAVVQGIRPPVYLRRGSPNILWDRVTTVDRTGDPAAQLDVAAGLPDLRR